MVEVGPTTITQDRLKPGGRTFNAAVGIGVVGLLLTAVGYAIGLPYEGMSRRRVRRMAPRGAIGHKLLLCAGLVSDDTEHTRMVAGALIRSGGDPAAASLGHPTKTGLRAA